MPNVSEGRDLATLEAIGRAFAPARFLDLHTDPDHDRAVFTLAARQGEMSEALFGGARSASISPTASGLRCRRTSTTTAPSGCAT